MVTRGEQERLDGNWDCRVQLIASSSFNSNCGGWPWLTVNLSDTFNPRRPSYPKVLAALLCGTDERTLENNRYYLQDAGSHDGSHLNFTASLHAQRGLERPWKS